jgi:adenosine deaminase
MMKSLPTGVELAKRLDFLTIPKVMLHEHLDGGLRPATVIELAREAGYAGLPTSDPGQLAAWFHRGAQRGNLVEYLEGFIHTTSVMQSREALERVAYEFMEDMAADGVVYVEVRFAPVFHIEKGRTMDEVVEAVIAGLTRGGEAFGLPWGLILCAMRHREDALVMAELAIRWRDRGVVGFDLAGGEAGFPPKKHLEAFHTIHRANFNITIHAGEAYGAESIWQALQWCGAHRLGHGTRLMEDVQFDAAGQPIFGTLARYVLDHRIPLEMCLSSNVHTGACERLESHPFPVFFRAGFRVSLNTDDRLMSDTELSKELRLATELFDLRLEDLERLALNAIKGAFAPHELRVKLMLETILPWYEALRVQLSEPAL